MNIQMLKAKVNATFFLLQQVINNRFFCAKIKKKILLFNDQEVDKNIFVLGAVKK